MKNKKIRRTILSMLMIAGMSMLMLSGCKISESDGTKVSDLDYTVVEEEKIPAELKNQIKEKKEADFKLTYENGGNLYIVRGYGEQETGGYSIAVDKVYLTTNSVCFQTTLLGPSESEAKTKAPSYPYIVVEIKDQGKNVVFN